MLKSLLWPSVSCEVHCLWKVRRGACSLFYRCILFAFGINREFQGFFCMINPLSFVCTVFITICPSIWGRLEIPFIFLFYEHYLINHVGNIPNNAFIRGTHCLKWSLQNLSPQGFEFIHTELNDEWNCGTLSVQYCKLLGSFHTN